MTQNEQIGSVLTKHFWKKKNDFKVENLENIYHFSSTILTLFYLISRRYMKKNQMKMHCVSHVVKGTVYITIISDNNSFFYPIVCSIV